MSQREIDATMMDNIREVDSQLKGSDAAFKTYLYYNLWQQLSTAGQDRIADFLYKNYLKQLATETKREDIMTKIEQESRLRVGSMPPEITWKEGGELKKGEWLDRRRQLFAGFWEQYMFPLFARTAFVAQLFGKPYRAFFKGNCYWPRG